MIGIFFIRVMRAALQNFLRNFWLTVATTVIMTITLLIFLFLYFANVFGLEVLRNIEQKVDLSVTFNDEITDEQINAIAREVESWKDVRGVQIISSDEALSLFRQRNKDKPFVEESLKELEENPLPPSMFIVANEPRAYQALAQKLSAENYSPVVAEVHFEDSRAVIERLITVISAIKNAGIVITLVFAALVLLIMFNTVRLAIYSFREEIDIMRLVGASGWFIRGPFVMESIFVAIVSVVFASGATYAVLKTVAPHLKSFFFEGYAQGAVFDIYQYAVDNWLTVVGLQLAIAVGLAIISSLIAIQRYLKT